MEGSLSRVNRAFLPRRWLPPSPAGDSSGAPQSRGGVRYNARVSTSFPLDGMRVRFAGATNIGRKRDHNEDSISLPETERLAIVADGMGGHASGEVASRLAVEIISDHFLETGKQQTLTWPYKV